MWRFLLPTLTLSCCVWSWFIRMSFHRDWTKCSNCLYNPKVWILKVFFSLSFFPFSLLLLTLCGKNYRTYFQCRGKSVLMCQHQGNSMSLLFIKLPVPLQIIYVSSVMFLQGVLLKEKRNRYLARKRCFWLQKSTCTYWQRRNRYVLPEKQITRPIISKPAVRRYNIYIVL